MNDQIIGWTGHPMVDDRPLLIGDIVVVGNAEDQTRVGTVGEIRVVPDKGTWVSILEVRVRVNGYWTYLSDPVIQDGEITDRRLTDRNEILCTTDPGVGRRILEVVPRDQPAIAVDEDCPGCGYPERRGIPWPGGIGNFGHHEVMVYACSSCAYSSDRRES